MKKPAFDPNTPPGEERAGGLDFGGIAVTVLAILMSFGLGSALRGRHDDWQQVKLTASTTPAPDQDKFQLLRLGGVSKQGYPELIAQLDSIGFRIATYDEFMAWNKNISPDERQESFAAAEAGFESKPSDVYRWYKPRKPSNEIMIIMSSGKDSVFGLVYSVDSKLYIVDSGWEGFLLIVRKDKPKPLVVEKPVSETVLARSVTISDVMNKWAPFYHRHFGFTILNFTDLQIPPKPEGDYRLVVVMPGATPNKAYAACETLFKCWKPGQNLDKVLESDVRRADKCPYAVWIYAGPEAEEQFANKSYRDLEATRHQRPTLTERLLFELLYFEETGQHFDQNTTTRCDGSRYPDGAVPSIYWDDNYDEMSIVWYDPNCRASHLRSRSAVSR